MTLRRWFLSGAALALALGSAASGALPASAAGQKIYKIGVDNAAPQGHDFLYVDFFPRADVKIHRGDVLDFSWNQGSIDGFHNVVLLPSRDQRQPFVVPDADDGPGQLQFNGAVAAPSDPTCGGSAAHPCVWTGSGRVNSGAAPTAPGNEWFVQVNVPQSDDPVAVTFFCEIHPGMKGTLNVVPDRAPRTSLEELANKADAQFRSDTREALEAATAADQNARFLNPDGTHTVTVTAGTATPYVEVAEMHPGVVRVEPGDTVKYVTRTIRDVHTVSFPAGGAGSVDPLQNVCEATPVDTPANSPFDCANPALFETHILPQPRGSNVISSASTIGSSGILATPPTPFPKTFSYSFPNAGSFAYQCLIHDNMVGRVVAAK